MPQYLNPKTVKIEAIYNESTGAVDIKASNESVEPTTIVSVRADGFLSKVQFPTELGLNQDENGRINVVDQ